MMQSDKKRIIIDSVFAIIYLALGRLYVEALLLHGAWGMNVTLFTFFYVAVVLAYIYVRGAKPAKESWFWLVVLLMCGLSFSLWGNESLMFVPILVVHLAAVYWTLAANNALVAGKSSAAFVYDGIRGFFMLPFRQFGTIFKSLFSPFTLIGADKLRRRKLLLILGGVLISLPILFVVLPLLMNASSEFALMMENVFAWIPRMFFTSQVVPIIWGCLVAMYLYGLSFGSAHYVPRESEELKATVDMARILPSVTVNTALFVFVGVYMLFFASQFGNMFAAFTGRTYAGASLSDFARAGFFSLCCVAAINLACLAAVSFIAQKAWADNKALRIGAVCISLETLLLIVSANSKMWLYIAQKGLTPKRLFTTIFMMFLAFVFILVIIRCKKQINIVRMSLFVFCAGMALLLCINVGGIIGAYNASRIEAGTMETTDICDIYYMLGVDGVPSAAGLVARGNLPNREELKDILDIHSKIAPDILRRGGFNLAWYIVDNFVDNL